MRWTDDEQKREKWRRFVRSLGPDVDPKALRLMDELGHVSRGLYHVGGQSLDEAGLSHAQYRVLMHLFFAEKMGERGELNPSEISDRQGVSRNTISALIRNLEEDGLIERRLDQEDRRRFIISLSESGRSLVTDYARQHLKTIGNCFTVLTADEQETLSQLLHKVRMHIEAARQQWQ